jgi:hypothetical protein
MKKDINDTLRDEGADAVRARHDKARRYEPEPEPSKGSGHTSPWDQAPPWDEARGERNRRRLAK